MLALLGWYELGLVTTLIDGETEHAGQVEGTLYLVVEQRCAIVRVAFDSLRPVRRLHAQYHYGPLSFEVALSKDTFFDSSGNVTFSDTEHDESHLLIPAAIASIL